MPTEAPNAGAPAHASRVLVLVALALLVHFARFAGHLDYAQQDTPTYLTPAQGLMAGQGFVEPDGPDAWRPHFRRTPVYPAFIAVVYGVVESPAAVAVAQKLLIALFVGGLYLFAVRVLRVPPAAAFVAALILALEPTTVLYGHSILSDVLFMLIVALACGAAVAAARSGSIGWAAGGGLLCGLAVLTRPIGVLFFAVPAVYLLVALRPLRRALPAAAMVCLLSVAFTGAWIARNHALTGVATLSSISGYNILYYRAAGTRMFARDIPYREARAQLRAEFEECLKREETRLGRRLNPLEKSRLEGRFGLEVLRADPRNTARTAAYGLARLLLAPSYPRVVGRPGSTLAHTIHLAQYAWSAVFLLLAALGLLIGWRRLESRAWLLLAVLTIVYFILLSLGIEAYSRFRLPFLPALALLAGLGVWGLMPRRGGR